jgi:predicted XRE-type DNA-binding protein
LGTIEDTPEEAANMKLRSALMMALEEHIRSNGWTQREAAARLHVAQPRISDLMRGKIDLFGLGDLVNMLTAVGLRVETHVAKAAGHGRHRSNSVGARRDACGRSWALKGRQGARRLRPVTRCRQHEVGVFE